MTDDELKTLLQGWRAPTAPATLRGRVFGEKKAWWEWLVSGDIRVPVPVALALMCLLLFVFYRATHPPVATLSDFEPVQEFKPRIVRTVR